MSPRMPLLELRALVAIYSGRIDVQPPVRPGERPGAYCLRGYVGKLVLGTDANGAVDRQLVAMWVRHEAQYAYIEAKSLRAQTIPPPT